MVKLENGVFGFVVGRSFSCILRLLGEILQRLKRVKMVLLR